MSEIGVGRPLRRWTFTERQRRVVVRDPPKPEPLDWELTMELKKKLASAAFAVAAVTAFATSEGPAHGACNGPNGPYPTSAGWAAEGPNSGTCDNLGDYNGWVDDTALDGQDVRIQYNRGGGWRYSQISTANPVWWGWTPDNTVDPDHSASYRMCQVQSGACASWGTNWGY